MMFTLRILVLLGLLGLMALNSVHAQQSSTRLDPRYAILMLSDMILTAQSFRAECAPRVRTVRKAETLTPWFQRNQPIIDQVIRISQQQELENWESMWKSMEIRARKNVLELVNPDWGGCSAWLGMFSDGSYELLNFPVHLEVVGVKPPAATKKSPKLTSDDASTALSNFIFTVEVLLQECVGDLNSTEITALNTWLQRNDSIIEQIKAKGEAERYFGDIVKDSVWAYSRKYAHKLIAEKIQSDRSICRDSYKRYSSGSMDLRNYPTHLNSLKIKFP